MVRLSIIRKIRPSRSYAYSELANLIGKCEATVRSWVKDGMPALTSQKPHLILGSDARDYLTKRFHTKKHKLEIGQVRCFKCGDRRMLEQGLAEIVPNGPSGWRLEGLCSECGTLCSRIIKASERSLHAEILELEFNEEIQA